jgi:hypothetical protein
LIFIVTLASFYVYMPVHFFMSEGEEELIRLYLWTNMASFYSLPLCLLAFKFSFELSSISREKEFDKLLAEAQMEKEKTSLSQFSSVTDP